MTFSGCPIWPETSSRCAEGTVAVQAPPYDQFETYCLDKGNDYEPRFDFDLIQRSMPTFCDEGFML